MLSDKFCFNSFSKKLVLIKIKRIGNFKDELFNKSFLENNSLPVILISLTLTSFSVLRLIKLVENKNKISTKKLLLLIFFCFFTNHIELFPLIDPSHALACSASENGTSISFPSPTNLNSAFTLGIHLLVELPLKLTPLIQLILTS